MHSPRTARPACRRAWTTTSVSRWNCGHSKKCCSAGRSPWVPTPNAAHQAAPIFSPHILPSVVRRHSPLLSFDYWRGEPEIGSIVSMADLRPVRPKTENVLVLVVLNIVTQKKSFRRYIYSTRVIPFCIEHDTQGPQPGNRQNGIVRYRN